MPPSRARGSAEWVRRRAPEWTPGANPNLSASELRPIPTVPTTTFADLPEHSSPGWHCGSGIAHCLPHMWPAGDAEQLTALGAASGPRRWCSTSEAGGLLESRDKAQPTAVRSAVIKTPCSGLLPSPSPFSPVSSALPSKLPTYPGIFVSESAFRRTQTKTLDIWP